MCMRPVRTWAVVDQSRFLVLQPAVPVFRHPNVLPRDLNVTEGESVNLHCGSYAEPEADVVWMQNGRELDRK